MEEILLNCKLINEFVITSLIVCSEEPQSQQAIINQQQKRARGGQGAYNDTQHVCTV